jgi:hypothetical protein
MSTSTRSDTAPHGLDFALTGLEHASFWPHTSLSLLPATTPSCPVKLLLYPDWRCLCMYSPLAPLCRRPFLTQHLFSTTNITFFLSAFSQNWAELETRMNSVERMKEYDNLEQEAPQHIPETQPPQDWPSKGSIRFKGLSISYNNEDRVLKQVSASIKAKEKIGIVGRTGAGKRSAFAAERVPHGATQLTHISPQYSDHGVVPHARILRGNNRCRWYRY